MTDDSILIVGANGQLGKALQQKYPGAKAVDIEVLDITNRQAVDDFDWSNIKTIINAAAYTNVDGAETSAGRVAAWLINAAAVGNLVQVADSKKIKLVHISTDYVFDGTKQNYQETEPCSPLSVYGASKAAGDLLVSQLENYYLLRTSWVIGEGKNFVRTMLNLARKGVNPTVVSDQLGRLTFTSELVRAIDYLLSNSCIVGTYNVTNGGNPVSWADVARKTFELAGFNNQVTDITTKLYYKNKPEAAPRPLNSILDLTKLKATGFKPKDWQEDLASFIKKELSS